MSRVTGLEMAESFSRFINSSLPSEREEFARTVVVDHRTLQQDSFLTFLKCIEVWSDCYDGNMFDARNEYAVKASKIMMQALKDEGMY